MSSRAGAATNSPSSCRPREDLREPSGKAERIIAEINRPFEIDGYEIIIGVSVGVARLQRDGMTIETLLSNADLALYAAKGEGRNRWRSYEPQLGLKAQNRRTLEIDLRAAIANETIDIHYQPINNSATREIVGCEALARWDHPTRGRISPAEFIPIAEELGLVDALGRSILKRACERLRVLARADIRRRQSVAAAGQRRARDQCGQRGA